MLDRKNDEIHTLVISSNLAVADIAEMYGFKNTSHFCRVYRKRHGSTPTEHREGK